VSRSKRLMPLAQIADRKQQDAARVFRQSRDELEGFEARLGELRGYREEYLGRFHRAGNGGLGAGQMKGYLVFLAKLDEAIRQLEALLAASRQQCETRRGEWVASRARFKALDEVIARYRSAERREMLRREQRNADEHSLQASHRK
jgi:flagellar FliJ protein